MFASTVIRRILAIPHYTHISSKNILRDLTEKQETHQQVVEEEEDQERM